MRTSVGMRLRGFITDDDDAIVLIGSQIARRDQGLGPDRVAVSAYFSQLPIAAWATIAVHERPRLRDRSRLRRLGRGTRFARPPACLHSITAFVRSCAP